MRASACLAVLAATKVAAHPLCFFDDRPTDFDVTLGYCGDITDLTPSGACCTSEEEATLSGLVDAAFTEGNPPSTTCFNLYQEVLCAVCSSYSAHLYEYLTDGGVVDGLTMKSDFCEELVDECSPYITFPTYDDGDYCEHHTGGGNDFFWSYPYEEPEVFEPGLNELFPELGSGEQPDDTVSMRQTPDGSQWWLVGIAGEIYAVESDNMDDSTLVIDVSGTVIDGATFYVDFEEGLLDVAFGPMFGNSAFPQYFYVSYTVDLNDGLVQRNRLARFTYIPGDASATKASEEILLTTVPKTNSIHSAGWLGFKPSVYGNSGDQDLYWTTGDGGPQTDPENHSQDPNTMLGAMMRITVPSDGSGYTIPSGNYDGALPEICAIGFRNPWRCSFDRQTDELYCGDVGHTFVEEIDLVECGNNYGWSRFEGSRCQEAVEDNEFNPACSGISRSGFTFPIFEYCHPDYQSTGDDEFTGGNDICGDRLLLGNAVIGGFVYRGNFFSDLLDGAYIFGDSTMSNIYYLVEEDGEWALGTIISDNSVQIISFAEDVNGEIMLLDFQHDIYHMPCGDLCATTCLEQAEDQPTYESLGCVADEIDDRALPTQASTCGDGENAMSPAICASYCETLGSTFFGVQFYSECFCGASNADYDKHGSLPDADCELLCDANPDFFCGGTNAMEVFTIEAPEETQAPATTPLVAEPIAPVAPSPTTPITPTPTDANFLGCWADAEDPRVFPESLKTVSETMTTATCAATCADFAYYATQWSIECWCGNNDAYDVNGEGACDFECGGDPSDICGGNFAMSVYSTGSDPVETPSPAEDPTDPAFLGCFVDDSDNRVLPVGTTSSAMTAALCADTCVGFAFYGTEFGEECFCGNNANYDANGEAVCNMACSGDEAEICGGFNAISVYTTGSDPAETPSPVEVDVTPEPVDVAEPTEPGYLGCFTDDPDDRVFPGEQTTSASMTAAVCASTCSGFTYYGTQWSSECWCGNNDDYDVYGASTECTAQCTGDSLEICGGTNAMSIYQNGDVTVDPTGGYTNLGCWSDPKESRMMVQVAEDVSMTTAICEGLCDGSAYYGTQFSTQCWCGDANTDFEADGTAECDYACSGDESEICGGFDAMTVYGPA